MEIGSKEYYEYIKRVAVRVAPGIAKNATEGGSICAARNGASMMGRAHAQSVNYTAWQEKKKARKINAAIAKAQKKRADSRASKNAKATRATAKQRALALKLGCELEVNCTANDAYEIIGKKLKAINHEKKVRKIVERARPWTVQEDVS